MKTLVGIALLMGMQAFAGGIQGNGIITPQIQDMLLQRAKFEVIAKTANSPILAKKLEKNSVTVPELSQASFRGSVDGLAPKMGESAVANRVLVAGGLADAFQLPTQLGNEFVAAIKPQSSQADFLTDAEFARVYPVLARPQPIKLGTPTVAGTMCNSGQANVFVDTRSQVIHVVVASGLAVDPWSKTLERGTCLLAVPVTKPASKGIVFNSVDVYGVAAKLGNAKLDLTLEAFVTGLKGTPVKSQLLPIDNSAQAKRFALGVKSNTAYAAGSTSAILRLNLSAVAIRNANTQLGLIGLDRISIKYSLK